MKLEEREDVLGLRFHLSTRQVEIFHENFDTEFDNDLSSINLGAQKLETIETKEGLGEELWSFLKERDAMKRVGRRVTLCRFQEIVQIAEGECQRAVP